MMKRSSEVMTPAKVVYARMPKSLVLDHRGVVMEKASLDPAITHLTRTWWR
jgi:hypothetical protein